MPRRRRLNIGRRARNTRSQTSNRQNRTEAQRLQQNELIRIRTAQSRSQQNEEERTQRLQSSALQMRNLRTRSRAQAADANRQEANRERMQERRSLNVLSFHRLAFQYDPAIDYCSHAKVIIGEMEQECQHCHALKFKHETPGMCCAAGKVVLPQLNPPPEPLAALISGVGEESKLFLRKIRKFNSCFQMTSFRATKIVTNRDDDGRNFETTFTVQGQVYHQIGSLNAMPGKTPKFLQIYFMGNEEDAVDVRCQHNHIEHIQERAIVASLQTFLEDNNLLLQLFKQVSPRLINDNYMVVIKANKVPVGQHARQYNAPTINDVAIVIAGDEFHRRDIKIRRRDDTVENITDTHPSYDALQYPLIFWQGDDGYHINIKQRNPSTGAEVAKNVSAMNYYAYRLMIRLNNDNHILKCRQLFHQYVVDMFAKIESERLRYIRFNQPRLRAEEYIHLRDAVNNNVDGNVNFNEMGNMIILPSSYTGSPRHMQEYIQDAMAYVRAYGRPHLFITLTCNPQWEEIRKLLLPGQEPHHRHDITARIFKQKLKSFIDFIVKHQVFGAVRCWMYSVEWQKRGLPHAHILVWLVDVIRPQDIDHIISAEIPDPAIDQELFDIVTKHMIHGPCGTLNVRSPCMENNKCTKHFPKDLLAETITGLDGYPLYRRRSTENGGQSFILHRGTRNEIEIDNRWVVPYSPLLSKTYKAHVNVEFCNSIASIKYICKYVHKGSDMAVFAVENVNENDEISRYQMGRYISSNEAVWRIFAFPIHERSPAVVHLAIHLENGQRVYFNEQNALERALTAPKTTLTEFFDLCQQQTVIGQFTRTLLYAELPTYFTWNKSRKLWEPRKRGKPVTGYPQIFSTDVLGRLYTVHPKQRECFYLRLLLINVRGPTSYEYLRTVNGQLCATNQDACQRLQLLEDDSHWDMTLADASLTSTPNQIRGLFAILLTTCFPTRPDQLWEKYKDSMTEDILHLMRVRHHNRNLQLSLEMYNEALIKIEDLCMLIGNEPLIKLGMPAPNRPASDLFNRDLLREQSFNTDELNVFVQTNLPKLLPQQKAIYDKIMQAIAAERGGFFFLDAPGGTGKTFLISLILAQVRSQRNIAVAVASSGIAATLLDGGRTAHSAFKLPLNIQSNDNALCNIKKNSGMAKVLQQCQIIIWDECTMAHKHSLGALHRTLQDLRGNQRIFGGALILLAGDFRQTLPVIPGSTDADQINACLKSSPLWRHVHMLRLTTNMRVQLQNDASATRFAKQLLDLGNGKMHIDETTQSIQFPTDFCQMKASKDELIRSVFPNITRNFRNTEWLSGRAILAARNVDVDGINFQIQDMLPGEAVTYKSIDTMVDENELVNYPIEFLNSLDLSGLPPHRLQLKVGSIIILLRNINPPRLCNGTRLVVEKLMHNVIEATILNGKFKGEKVLLPRIPMIPNDTPFQFKRLQFPIRLAFAMTINKAQGQSMQRCGLDLENPCFSHGQLYVACSRVGKPSDLFVYAPDGRTKNIVHELVL